MKIPAGVDNDCIRLAGGGRGRIRPAPRRAISMEVRRAPACDLPARRRRPVLRSADPIFAGGARRYRARAHPWAAKSSCASPPRPRAARCSACATAGEVGAVRRPATCTCKVAGNPVNLTAESTPAETTVRFSASSGEDAPAFACRPPSLDGSRGFWMVSRRWPGGMTAGRLQSSAPASKHMTLVNDSVTKCDVIVVLAVSRHLDVPDPPANPRLAKAGKTRPAARRVRSRLKAGPPAPRWAGGRLSLPAQRIRPRRFLA